MNFDLKPYEERMKKTVSVLVNEFDAIRVGRASAKLLERIRVDYYGTPSPIESVAQIKTQDARTLVIIPWEAKMLRELEKAIQASDLGITPVNDGKQIRLTFPPLTEERRIELTKKTAKMGEDAKVAMRNIRRDANEEIKKLKKDGVLTEDDQKKAEKQVQDLTDRYIKEAEACVSKKDKEILEI